MCIKVIASQTWDIFETQYYRKIITNTAQEIDLLSSTMTACASEKLTGCSEQQ